VAWVIRRDGWAEVGGSLIVAVGRRRLGILNFEFSILNYHRISSHFIASHRISSHLITSHLIALVAGIASEVFFEFLVAIAFHRIIALVAGITSSQKRQPGAGDSLLGRVFAFGWLVGMMSNGTGTVPASI